jgi:hypothetical protein
MANAARVTQQSVEIVLDEASSDNLRITRQYVEVILVQGSAPPTLNRLVQVVVVNG